MDAVEQDIVLECPAHGLGVPEVRPNGPHLEARCSTCQRHLKFVPKRPQWLALSRTI